MAHKGGVEVRTLAPGSNGEPGTQGFRTIIHPDADLLTTASCGALNQPELWAQHRKKLLARLKSLQRFRYFLKGSIYAYSSATSAYSGYKMIEGEIVHTAAAAAALISLAYIGRAALRKWVKYKGRKLMSALKK